MKKKDTSGSVSESGCRWPREWSGMSNPGDNQGRGSPDLHPFRMTKQELASLDPSYKKPKKKVGVSLSIIWVLQLTFIHTLVLRCDVDEKLFDFFNASFYITDPSPNLYIIQMYVTLPSAKLQLLLHISVKLLRIGCSERRPTDQESRPGPLVQRSNC
jgi:hypothetical protein